MLAPATGATDSSDYGQIRAFGKNILVHRVAWELMGQDPKGNGAHRTCVCPSLRQPALC